MYILILLWYSDHRPALFLFQRKALRGSSRPFSILQANTTAPQGSRRATYNPTSPKVLVSAKAVMPRSPVLQPQPVIDKENTPPHTPIRDMGKNTPPQTPIRDMGIASYSPAFLQKQASRNLDLASTGFFPSPQLPLTEEPEEPEASSPDSPQFEDSLMAPPAQEAHSSQADTSKQGGTFEMDHTDSILYQKSNDYESATPAPLSLPAERGEGWAAEERNASKRDTFDMNHTDSILYQASYDYGKSPQAAANLQAQTKDSSITDTNDSKHGGTFELDQTDSILYQQTYNYDKSRVDKNGQSGVEDGDVSKQGTFELDEASICLSKQASFGLSDVSPRSTDKPGLYEPVDSASKYGRLELDTTAQVACENHGSGQRPAVFGETITKYVHSQDSLLEPTHNRENPQEEECGDVLADSLLELPSAVPSKTPGHSHWVSELPAQTATCAAFVAPVGHASMMQHLTAVRQNLQEKIIASTPLVQNSRASFDSLTGRKLPSPVHGKPCRMSDSAVQSGFFPSPYNGSFSDNHRKSSGENPKRNSRKLLFPENACSNPGRISNVTITKVGLPEAIDRGPAGAVANVTVTKSGPADSIPQATFQEIPSPNGRRISTLTVTKPRSSIGHVKVTTDCGVDSLCQQLSLSINEEEVRSPPAKLSRSVLDMSENQMAAGNAKRSLYLGGSPKRTVCTPIMRQSLNTPKSTQKLSEKRKALRRSGKLRKHHRRSVTHTLDEHERSFCDLPEVRLDEPADVEAEVLHPEDNGHHLSLASSQKLQQSLAMKRLAKSPAKYSGIFMEIQDKPQGKPAPSHQPSVSLKTSVAKAKLRVTPKGKPSKRLSSEALSRGSSRRRSHGGTGPSSLSSLTRPTAASKARSSQPTHSIQVAVTIQEVSAEPAEVRPKGFTRTMELRRKGNEGQSQWS